VDDIFDQTTSIGRKGEGRIQLIANQLAKELKKHKVVDWDTRESVQAKLRNVARATLRKYGYPLLSREPVVEKLIEVAERELASSAADE